MQTDLIPTLPPSKVFSTHRICSLAELFAVRCAEKKGLAFRPLSPEAVALIASYDWKGDLSAMEATICHAMIMADGDAIDAAAIRLPFHVSHGDKPVNDGKGTEAALRTLLGRTVSDVERDLTLMTLKYCRGNRTQAANILGISLRTLRNKLKRYSLSGTAIPDSDGAWKSNGSQEPGYGQAVYEPRRLRAAVIKHSSTSIADNEAKEPPATGPFNLPQSGFFHFKNIDREHQQLVDILNTMAADFGGRDRVDGIRFVASIMEMRDRMAAHFTNEEREMAAAGFGGLAVHSKHHAATIAKLNEMHAETSSLATVGKEPMFDLFNHVLADVLKHDLPFKDFLAANGLIKPE